MEQCYYKSGKTIVLHLSLGKEGSELVGTGYTFSTDT